jgi:hypothetical protein
MGALGLLECGTLIGIEKTECRCAVATGGQSAADGGMGGSASGAAPSGGGAVATGGAGGAGSSTVTGSDLLLWLRSDKGTMASGGQVSLWMDQSPTGAYDAKQGFASKQPLLDTAGSYPTLQFDGYDDLLDIESGFDTFSGGLTIFLVAHPTTERGCGSYLYLGNGDEADDISLGILQNRPIFEVDNAAVSGDTDMGPTEPLLLTAVLDNTSGLLRQDGEQIGAGTMSAVRSVTRVKNYIGAPAYTDCGIFGGSLEEIIVYGRALTPSEFIAVEAELRARWF